MTTVTLEEVQTRLPELLENLYSGERLTITNSGLPVAQMTKTEATVEPRKAGSYSKPEFWMAPDFNEPLEELKESTE